MGKKKILVVDDEAGFTEMVKLNLETTGNYEVMIENQGSQAVTTALLFEPDLILLDVIMPDREGPDVVCEIREKEELQSVPVVFLTATIRKDEVKEQSGNIGGHVFLAKPTSLEELIECIEEQLSK